MSKMAESERLATSKSNSPDEELVPAYRKDQKLDRLANTYNVAQFVSFAPGNKGPVQQYCRIAGISPNTMFESVASAIEALFSRSSDGTINIRSFSETESQSREFIYALRSVDDALAAINRISSEGAFVIANETIDVSDGGVSGVAMGGLVEFRPDSTPRGVEQPGFASLPLDWAVQILRIVYGFDPNLEQSCNTRLEFSIHPKRRGWRQSNVIFWEYGSLSEMNRHPDVSWPNDFSRMLGDKVYGLLVAHSLGLPVPRTTVINRRVAPFTFGNDTGASEQWIRTSPFVQFPGKFTTAKGWRDPFALLQSEDPEGKFIASVLSQQSVSGVFSGAAIETPTATLVIEGTKGSGERLMLGTAAPEVLPEHVLQAVRDLYRVLRERLGSVRFEWVYDGSKAWIVQLHTGASKSSGRIVVPGEPDNWIVFRVAEGLEALRQLLASLAPNTGIYLDGVVGLTSHVADVVRKANVPTRFLDKRDDES